MSTEKRNLFIILVIILTFVGLITLISIDRNKQIDADKALYKVEITYCDARAKDTVNIISPVEPTNDHISNYKRAVPEFQGYLNVCNIKVIKKIKIK